MTRPPLGLRSRVLLGAAGVTAVAALAELAARLGHVDPLLLPPPSSVLAAAAELPADPEFVLAMYVTSIACVLGLAAAIAVAVPAGLLLGALPAAERAIRPIIEVLRPIPSIALIPLAVFVLGEPHLAKTALIVYACTWPILITTLYGMATVDPVAVDTLRAFGFGPVAILRRVCLPSTAPHIATGIRLALAVALIVSVSAEVSSGGMTGIGTYIVHTNQASRSDLMAAAAVAAGLLGWAATAISTWLERRLFPWHSYSIGPTS
ncbi:ABC transporter permease subunit [Nonomuraea sp. NPDC026600]|uniref:ABC transporter permease n=1 Tax=Nonomuraea sp. NPDC026600 TaxID=3155363 RepID=UPI00340706C4